MAEVSSTPRASYALPLSPGDALPASSVPHARASLPEPLLLQNVVWFCRIRWIVVALLALFGLLGLFPPFEHVLGLRTHLHWPIVTAGVLALANLGFLSHARLLARSGSPPGARVNLWTQIVVDLVALTVVVHYVGSLETYIAFAYLFHIVLACIFFSRLESFGVAAMACVFYVACVALEVIGLLPAAGLYADHSLRGQMERTPGVVVLSVASALVVWLVVWYFASHLSMLVRERDSQLDETNRRLVGAQREKSRHMLLTAHELKAPFAAIHANVHLLLHGHCGDLPTPATEALNRIAGRCRRMAVQIQEMLQLANIETPEETPSRWVDVDLTEALRWSLAEIQPLAEERGITVEHDLRSTRTCGVEDHVKMLFLNLLSNAVTYSNRGERVNVRCLPGAGNGPIVTIEDQGIGIPAEKLPRIFEEYYRTAEAVRHNKESTGLGLAIVRRVAETHGIQVRVESAAGVGTKFILRFPAAESSA
jgi:two-component system phosphate regulon sensor histidine kinase PhoR